MARSAARLKMGYYPLPESEGANLRKLLSFTGLASVVDPCVGRNNREALVQSSRLSAPVRRIPMQDNPPSNASLSSHLVTLFHAAETYIKHTNEWIGN